MVASDLDNNNNTFTSSTTTTTTTTSTGASSGSGDLIQIQLDDEVEGDRQFSGDIFFVSIGQSVPIKPPASFAYDESSHLDLQTLPSQPLALSERLSLIFLAHSTGFCVARTNDVIELAKEIEDKGSGSSIQELSIVDVPLGKVNILALSSDSSTLAASIDGDIHFFSVESLLNKEQKPSFSCSLDNLGCVKDLRWTRKLEDYYVVLSSCGHLYYGAGQGPLKHVMDNVDAVEWSTKGNSVAVARKNILSIMSSKFKQKLSMSLSFKSCAGDSDVNCVIKVDCIRWVRSDCIILGCFQLTADGKEENYLVQVITSKNGKITDASSKHIVLYFNDVFEDFGDDVVPIGSGPHLFLSYIDQWEFAIAANRKNIQQLALFGWSVSDEKNEAAVIDLLESSWLPRIEVQGNGDDNIILGLCVDKVSNNEKVRLQFGEELKELQPCCIVLCLTIEGKLIMFRVASLTGATVPAEVECTLSDEQEDATAVIPSGHGLSKITSGLSEQSVEQEIIKEHNRKEVDEIPMKNDLKLPEVNKSLTNILSDQVSRKETVSASEEVRNIVNAQIFETDEQQKAPVVNLNQDTDGRQSLQLGRRGTYSEQSSLKTSHLEGPRATDRDLSKTVNQNKIGVIFNTDSFIGKVLTDKPGQSILIDSQKGTEVGKESPGSIGLNSLQIAASQSRSSGNLSFSKASDVGSSLLPSSYGQRNETNNSGKSLSVAHFSGGPIEKPLYSPATPSISVNPSGRLAFGEQKSAREVRSIEPLPEIGSRLSTQGNFVTGKASNKETSGTPSHTGLLKSEPNLSKQSQNVEEMAKELDALLECIEGRGGFRDASTILQESSVVALEEGIGTLSGKCRRWRSIMDEGLGDIQQLLDKTVQVLARKIYVEGIVKQATDSQYWDLWDRQRLSSELELKRSHVLKVNQDLTNQLIELERHFNTLELNKFGESGEAQLGQRAFLSRYGPSRHVQSLHCLHNTMSSQLATAEQLSQCLSKQMDVLSIESPSTTKKNVKKELFETIGIPYNSASFSSPDARKDSDTPSNKRLLISSSSAVVKDQSRRNQSSAMKNAEQESARRRRDSLGRSLASFEPPKTTVKRMLLQEEHQKGSVNRSTLSINKQHLDPYMLEESALAGQKLFTSSSTFLNTSENKGIHKPTKQASETPSSHSIRLKSPVMQVLPGNIFSASSSQFASHSSPLASQNGAQFEVPLRQRPSVSTRLPSKTDSMPKRSSEMSDTDNREVSASISSIGSVKQRPINIVNSIFNSARSESPFAPVPATGPAYRPTANFFDSDTATSDSQPADVKFSSSSSLSLSSPSSPMMNSSSASHFSLLTPSTAPTVSPAMSLGRLSTSSKATADANQTVSLAKSSTSSSPTLSTRPSFQVHEKLVPSSSLPPSMDLTSESTSKTVPQPQIAKSNVEAENSSGKTSSMQPGPPSGTFSLKLADSIPPAPRSEPTTNLQFGSNLSFNGMANTGINLNPEPGLSFATPVLSSTSLSTSESAVVGGKDGNSQEDEMEEEAPETSVLTLGNFGGFGIGSTTNPSSSKPNPFGGAFANAAATPMSSPPFSMAVPTGELFRPASFNFQSPQASQPSPPANFGAFSGGFSPGNTAQASTGGGFGQAAQIGPGQQALGSVLGTFGQSRQFGAGLGGNSVSSVNGVSGGFVNSTGGAFASIGSTGGGFGSLASAGGGFGSLASAGGGFAGVASAGVGFAGSASGSGLPMGGGGFGAFNNQQGSGGFAGFGSGVGGTGRPASELFTQMRK